MTRGPKAVISTLFVAVVGLLFWSAHRAASRDEQRAHSASQDELARSVETTAFATSTRELPAPSATSASTSAPTPQNEMTLMDELRRFKDTDPQFAVDRAREGNVRFPNSADAPERTSILIHALSALGQTSEARGISEDMVNRYPDSVWVREIERFTGAHRHRNAHVDASGRLAYDDASATQP